VRPLYIVGTQRDVGKTTFCIGLISALRERGLSVGYTKPLGQRVNLLLRIVESQRGTRRGRNSKALHQGLGAVVTGPNGDTPLVEDRTNVVGMNTIQDERNDAGFLTCCADQAHSGYSGKCARGVV